ncbi:MAG: PDZ domain-containing protein [Candidatus Zixiibacteriota bacterium]
MAQDYDERWSDPVSYPEDTIPEMRREGLPIINFKINNQFLMRNTYPEYYSNEQQISRDIRWVNRNDTATIALWEEFGDSILAVMEDFSGIEWIDQTLDFRLLKYYRRAMSYDPLAIPLEGLRMEDYTEAAPTGLHRLLNMIKAVAGRNLMQLNYPEHTFNFLKSHQLLEPTAYRFDIMTLALAIATAEFIIPADSLKIILDTDQWKRHNPGFELYKSHFRFNWIISIDSPLVVHIAEEPYNSSLVVLTRPPRIEAGTTDDNANHEPIKLSAGQGRLGFSVYKIPKGFLEVVDVDSTGIAYYSGLMVGDKIKRVNGEFPRNARDLMEKIIDKIDTDGVYLTVIREDLEIGLLMLPPEEIDTAEEYYDPYYPDDSL